jgi:hypothetical protein
MSLLLLFASEASAQPGGSPSVGTTSLTFGGVTYVHRWSQGGQHEFTPEGDGDLNRWTDMITFNVHASVRDGEALAAIASGVLANYEKAGMIVRTDSKPRTPTAPAEHFIAAVLGNRGILEATFARFMLVGGRGIVVVRSHRVYGAAAGSPMAEWLKAEGQRVEETLVNWSGAPSVLSALPAGG